MTRTLPREAPPHPYDAGVGFDPFRGKRTNLLDIALVVGTILTAVALVLWAGLSG
jgi:hypothetical protein